MKTVKEKEQEKELRRLKKLATRKPRQVFYHVDAIAFKTALRKSALKQRQVAKVTKIHDNSISAFTTGKMNPSKDELKTLCAFLKVTQKSLSAKRIGVLL